MAEETLQCPSCNQKVRAPQELLGQPVQCPLCRQIFTAPVRGGDRPPELLPVVPGRSPGDYETQKAIDRLPPDKGPAIALLRWPATLMVIIGALGLAYQLFQVFRIRSMGIDGLEEELAAQREVYDLFGMNQAPPPAEVMYTFMLITWGVGSVVRLTMLFGGVQMLRMRGYGMALVGCLAALIPLFDCPCCVFSPAIGIWSLVVLFQPVVRSSFE